MAKRKRRRKKTISSVFRKIYTEQPSLLHTKSNDEALEKFKDLTGKEVTPRYRAVMSSVKNKLRKEAGGKSGRKAGSRATALETLEENIDECLSRAKELDRQGLETVIHHLHRARNEVVWKLGQ